MTSGILEKIKKKKPIITRSLLIINYLYVNVTMTFSYVYVQEMQITILDFPINGTNHYPNGKEKPNHEICQDSCTMT